MTDFETPEFYQEFESLGANCEFGLVQRHFGAEPLGLLRWPAISVDGLLASLQSGFSELDDISNLTLIPAADNTWDVKTPHFSLHLYTQIGSEPEEAVLASAFRRIQFMRRMLIENLEENEKIFVFKEWRFRMSDADIANIDRAVKNFNRDNRLLAVRLAPALAIAGSVALVSDGLWSGYVELDEATASAATVPLASWIHICRTIGSMTATGSCSSSSNSDAV